MFGRPRVDSATQVKTNLVRTDNHLSSQAIGVSMRHLVCIAASLAVAAVHSTATADDDLRLALEQRIESMDCPGALVGIFPDSGASTVYTLGIADRKSKAPMRRDFHMRVASVTKLFVGNVVLQLLDERKLSLDDSVSKYVAGVPNGEAVSLRQLGNNTSGLFNSIENKEFQAAIVAKPHKEWTPSEILGYAFAKPPYFAPGKGWHYSNTNTIVLAQIIEKVEGASLAEVVKRRVTEPLDLKATGFAENGVPPKPFPSAYRNGYKDKWIGYGSTPYEVTNYSASWTGAAGNMYSTLDDLGRAAKSLATGALLKDRGRRELFNWVDTDEEKAAYGFCISRSEGGIGHMGDVPGYQAIVRYYPASQVAVVVLTNLSNNKDGTMPAEELVRIIQLKVAPAPRLPDK